jgi:serine/threonine protein kinase/cytochrome c-type biogenesis protein CcmH/NrfG
MQPGQRIAHYEILGAIGRGGMGVVYRARDTKLDRVVALKFLPPELGTDRQAKERFVREARSASALDHPNICTIHDIAEADDGRLYIVMGFYEGRTLKERLEQERFSVARCTKIGRQLAAALVRAHGAGIVHRDLKPANVMVLDDDSVRLLDFGVAKLTTDEDLTATGGTIGTISYMSPEQLHGQSVDGRSDLWALGVVLYELLGGRRPFDGDTSAAAITAILNQAPEPLQQLRPDLPAAFGDLIERCLQKDREQRPPDAAAVQRELEAIDRPTEPVRSTRTLAVPAAARSGRAMRWIGIVLAALVVGAAALSWWALSTPKDELERTASDLLAVFPFSVRGSDELAYLAEGMVDLMSSRLDGLGTTRTVDPRVVFSRLEQDDLDPADPEAGAMLASRVGAGRWVTGDLVQVGDRVTLTVYLHDAEADGAEPDKATVEGAEDEVFALIDAAVADLATHSVSDPGDRLQRAAALTSQSLEATKAYLRGETLLRAGRYREAAEAYEAALASDPEFALAHYRKSLAADWIDAHDVRTSAERALDFAERLSPRDKSLLEALLHRRHGRNREAEQAYRAILHRYPNEVEALLQLGEVLFHDNPRVGRDMLESFEPFRRVLELEPSNANARIHLARLHALRGEHGPLREIADAFAVSSAESERLHEVEALRAFVLDDAARQDRIVEQLAGKPAPFLFYAAHGVTRFARSADGAQRILAAGGSAAALLLAVRAGIFLEQGRFEDFDAFLGEIPENDSACWKLYRAFVLTSGIVPVDEPRMTALLAEIRDLAPEEILKTSWLPPYEDMTPGFAAFERDYHVALLAIHTGRIDEARGVMAEMERHDPFPGLGSLRRDALAGLEAEIHHRDGDDASALAALRTIEYEIPHAISVRSVGDGTRSRFLRAALEEAAAEYDVARAYYVGLDHSWSWWDTGYRPRVYLGLARIAELQNRYEDARRAYRRLLDLWDEADPVLHARRDEARAALAALPGG